MDVVTTSAVSGAAPAAPARADLTAGGAGAPTPGTDPGAAPAGSGGAPAEGRGEGQDTATSARAAQVADGYLAQLSLARVVAGRSDSPARPADLTPGQMTGLIVYLESQLSLRADLTRQDASLDLRG